MPDSQLTLPPENDLLVAPPEPKPPLPADPQPPVDTMPAEPEPPLNDAPAQPPVEPLPSEPPLPETPPSETPSEVFLEPIPPPEVPSEVPPPPPPLEAFPQSSPPVPPTAGLPPEPVPVPTNVPSSPLPPEEHSSLKSKLPLLAIPIILILLVFGVLKLVLPRFQKTPAHAPPITLTYWGLWEPEEVMNAVIGDWEKAHPNVRISYVRQSPKDYRERLQSALARNEGPDIFRFHVTWVPMLSSELETVPSQVATAAQADNFYQSSKDMLRSGNNYLGLPLEVDTLSLFYNEDIFQAAGRVPPTDWNELRQLAKDLRTPTDPSEPIRTAGVALGTTNNVDHWSDILALMMLQNGADLTKPTDQTAQDALTWYSVFSKTDKVWDDTLPASTQAFASGKVAMYFGFSWDVFEIQNLNKNLKFKIVPVPQLPGTNVNWASYWAEGVAQKSKNKDAAWQFVQFLSAKENLQKLYQAASNVRMFGEPYARTDLADLVQTNPLAGPFVSQAAKAKTWYLCSRTFDNGINDRMIKYYEDAVNAVNTGQPASQALQTTASGVAQLLSQYNLGSNRVK